MAKPSPITKSSKNSAKAVRGHICQEKSGVGKAIEHYEKFLHLWKDADPGIAEVEDAKRRVVELQELH